MGFRLWLLMRKEFLQFFRNAPLIAIVLYCFTLDISSAGSVSMDLHNYPLAVYDLDGSRQSEELIGKFREPYFRVAHVIREEAEIRDLISSGRISVVLVFPRGFGRKIGSSETAEVQAILDGSLSNASQLALGYLSQIIDAHNRHILFTTWKLSDAMERSVPLIRLEQRFLFNPNLIDRWNFSLQELFIDVTLIGLLLIATAMVNEKQFGTIEQLMVTPLTTTEIMLSKIVPMIAILLAGTFIGLFVMLRGVIGMPLVGSVAAFFLVTLVYIFTITGLGLFVSTISNQLADTVLFSILVLVPIMFLSGAFVPVESMPAWMQGVVGLSPLKYYISLGTGILLKGDSLFLLWGDFLKLFSLGAVCFAAGAIRFRKVFQ